MLTLKDVARHVGVSISTVSLVLNDRSDGRVKPEVAERIRATAAELGYVPNLLARGLKTRQTHTIGLVSDRVATVPFAGPMLAGAQQAAWEEGYLLLLIDTAGNNDLVSPAVKSLLQRNIEALIFAATFDREVEFPLVPESVPVVVLDGTPADPASTADSVVPDERGGARTAVERLIASGHTRIGFCNVDGEYRVASELRLAGYREALDAAGVEFDESLIVRADGPSTADALGPARELLSRTDRPSGVFCFGDQIAMGFYQAATLLGLSVPVDVSIIGFDNQQFVADSLMPGLTTIQLPHREMGVWAVERALARMNGRLSDPAPARHLMPCPLVERSSVAAPFERNRSDRHREPALSS